MMNLVIMMTKLMMINLVFSVSFLSVAEIEYVPPSKHLLNVLGML